MQSSPLPGIITVQEIVLDPPRKVSFRKGAMCLQPQQAPSLFQSRFSLRIWRLTDQMHVGHVFPDMEEATGGGSGWKKEYSSSL